MFLGELYEDGFSFYNEEVNQINYLQGGDYEIPYDLAKNFILSNKKVNNVIFGVKKSDHIDSIIESCSQIRLSKDIEKKLIDLYKNDYGLVGESDLTL